MKTTHQTGRKAFKHPIEWTRAINDVLNEIIRAKKLDKTLVCEQAGYSKNFLAKLESGDKKMISLDEIEPFAQVLGMRTVEIALLAEGKKRNTPLGGQVKGKKRDYKEKEQCQI